MTTKFCGKTKEELEEIIARDEMVKAFVDTPSFRLLMLRAEREKAIERKRLAEMDIIRLDNEMTKWGLEMHKLNQEGLAGA